ncbi:MAG: 30S ribosomal protein S5 [Candidatus Peribacter sp.]|nr:30S ribosomal protein S5 [Candidatus Peribacter sp.]
MAKSSRPDRKKGDRRPREHTEFDEVTLSVDRVTRVVAGGRRMRFRAIVVIGNKKGKVGLGTGKAAEVQAAVKKATVDAKRHMVRIPLREGTIPHQVNVKYKAAKIRLLPACKGTGLIAGGAVRVILEQAGVQDVLSKRFGSSNKLVNAQAVMIALEQLKWKGGMPAEDTPEKKPLKETEGARQDAAALAGERLGVTEVSKKDVIQ